MKKIILNSVFLFSIHFLVAQNYQLDTTFGNGGKILNLNTSGSQTILLQPDGKIVSCYLSSFQLWTSGNIYLTRFNSNGSVDTTFGVNGVINTMLVSETGGIKMFKLQSDGKILVTGCISSIVSGNLPTINFCTARFNINGTIDTTFGANGYAITNMLNSINSFARAIDLQSDGKILVGGSSGGDFALVRYLPTGIVDSSFGISGKFIYNFGVSSVPMSSSNSNDQLLAIEVSLTGKIVLGGVTTFGQTVMFNEKIAVVSLNQNGAIDTSFGDNGRKILDFGGIEDFSNLKITADEKIIVCGGYSYTVQASTYSKILIAKLLSSGNFDSTFGTNGIVLTNRTATNLNDYIRNLNVLSDGKIIAVGVTGTNNFNQYDFLTIRLNSNGTFDNTFNNVGYFVTNFNNTNSSCTSFVLQNDDKIISSGYQIINNIGYGCLSRHEPLPLSITNLAIENNYKVYPNPFSDSINLDFDNDENQIATIELLDTNGRKIADLLKNQKIDAGNSKLRFDLPPNLSNGVYFLKISNDKDFKTIKIIK